MRYLITGSSGQLARELIGKLEARSAEYAAPDESRCDIADPAAVGQAVAAFRPTVIVNCAAYNLVDRAEQDRDTAFRVNETGPRVLAGAARKAGARLIHFSTDYVFDGTKETGLYTETDPVNPLNEYGRSKLAGERAVQEVLGSDALVLRLSWVFGPGQQNFIRKFLERVAAGEPLQATYDEFSVPTWTGTVADVTLRAVAQGMTGLYHLTNSGYCSRYEWAKLILRARGEERFVLPVPLERFGLPARRPRFTAMSNTAIANALSLRIPPWEETVAAFVQQGGAA